MKEEPLGSFGRLFLYEAFSNLHLIISLDPV